VVYELANLGSSRVTVPPGVFRQELREPIINKALSKASKTTKSVEGTTPLNDDKLETSNVMTIHSD
jgi:hypothetical protein